MTNQQKQFSGSVKTFALLAIGVGALVAILAAAAGFRAPDPQPTAAVTVYKSPACGCCSQWVNQLEASGLDVDVVDVADVQTVGSRMGVPAEARSCHTAKVGDYWVEGHVPPDLVAYLIKEKPEGIAGLAVPGMVIGSPGMEGPNAGEYDVIAYDSNGNSRVFAKREGQAAPR